MNIYHAICATDGIDATLATPADVTAKALAHEDRAAVETVSLFSTYLGASPATWR